MIRALFEQVATPAKLGPLGLVEVLDWTGRALNRVDRAAFFAQFEEDHAVQYFYEPFLEAFDPELRKELGVWYTPPEIVQYRWPAWIPCCGRNWTSPTAWPTPGSMSSTPAAAPGPTWWRS